MQTLLLIEVRQKQVSTLVGKLDPCGAHRLAAYGDPNTGMHWLNARPTIKDNRNAVSNDAWMVGMMGFLGIPQIGLDRVFGPLGKKCRCGVTFSSDPLHHLLSGNCFSGKTEVHNSSRDNFAEITTGNGLPTKIEALNGLFHDADNQINAQIDGAGKFQRTACDWSHPHPTDAAMQNRTSKQIHDNYALALVSKTYNSKCKAEIVRRLNEFEVNCQPMVVGTHGEIEPRSLFFVKCIAATVSKKGFWKDKCSALTRHILTSITLNLFRAKADMLLRVMREIHRNQFLSLAPETALIVSAFSHFKTIIAVAKLNEPYLRFALPALNIRNDYF